MPARTLGGGQRRARSEARAPIAFAVRRSPFDDHRSANGLVRPPPEDASRFADLLVAVRRPLARLLVAVRDLRFPRLRSPTCSSRFATRVSPVSVRRRARRGSPVSSADHGPPITVRRSLSADHGPPILVRRSLYADRCPPIAVRRSRRSRSETHSPKKKNHHPKKNFRPAPCQAKTTIFLGLHPCATLLGNPPLAGRQVFLF